MALIRNIDFRQGNSVEQVTSTLPSIYCLINRTKYGYAIDSVSNVRSLNFASGGVIPFGTGDWSVEFVALCDNAPSSTRWFFGQGGSSAIGVQIYNSGGVLPSAILRDSAGTIVNPFVSSGYQRSRFIHYVLVCDRTSGKTYFIVNGVKQSEVSTAGLVGSLTNTGILTGLMAYGAVTNDTMTGQMLYFKFYDHVVTVSEANEYYNEALNFRPIAEPKREFVYNKPTSLNKSDLVLAYNMKSSNATSLLDISGNNRNATLSNLCTDTKDGIQTTGLVNTDYIKTVANLTVPDVLTVAMAFKVNTIPSYTFLAEHFSFNTFGFRLGINNSNFVETQINRSGAVENKASSNKVFSNSINTVILHLDKAGTGCLFVNGIKTSFTFTSMGVGATTLSIGRGSGAVGLNGEYIDFQYYNRQLSDEECIDYHDRFANVLQLQDSFSDSPADNLTNIPRDWEYKSGEWKVREFIANESVLTDVVKKDKYLECTSTGIISLPDNSAYGTWEFDWFKGADANVIRILFASDRVGTVNETQGYYFTVTANEQVGIIKNSIGSNTQLMLTANSYIANNTLYRAKILRTNAGEFTLLLKGGSLTPTPGYNGWHFVSATGGTGTNPVTDTAYTKSNYFCNVLATGDRFTNLKHFRGIIY